MNAIGAERIPDPTTAGDFLRRFNESTILQLMEIFNKINRKMWKATLDEEALENGIIDIDSTIQETYGECKEGMNMSYKGLWGFAPLVITEATTGSHLYTVNRPGNRSSNYKAGEWIDKSIKTTKTVFKNIYLRGDSAFSLTRKFDGWTEDMVKFILGFAKSFNLELEADCLHKNQWKRLYSSKKRKGKRSRKKKTRVKENVVIAREYNNQVQKNVYVSEFKYRPVKCKKEYRVIVVKKMLDIKFGQLLLFEDHKYFFYITNIWDKSPAELVHFINGRCNHENKIEQLDNGIHALKMPASEFMANWAYMAICSFAWNVKSFVGLLMPDKSVGKKIINCEFKSFQNSIINIPCQVLSTGRSIVYRFLNYNDWVENILAIHEEIKRIKFSSA